MKLSRRKALKNIALGSALLSMPKFTYGFAAPIMKRAIPSSGEKIGVVGLGTYKVFDVDTSAAKEPLKEVLKNLTEYGGGVIDSSPMYGFAEKVIGELCSGLKIQNSIFYATKVWTTGKSAGISQMESSMQKMSAKPMDLMQIHNLQDWKTHLKTLYEWKEKGLIRYIGITHYTDSSHDQMQQIVESENIDFIQINNSIVDRNAEISLLPAAMDKGVAVLPNMPYARGSLFGHVKGKSLPPWAAEFDCKSWGQFFLKYLLANPAVTCVIPGTSNPQHMLDNLGAGIGRMPTPDHRKKMVDLVKAL